MDFQTNQLAATLEIRSEELERGGDEEPDSQTLRFRLQLIEHDGALRSLEISEGFDDIGLRILVRGDAQPWVVQLIDGGDRQWLVQDARGDQAFAAGAATFRELYEQNREYFDDQFFPLLQQFGIQAPAPTK